VRVLSLKDGGTIREQLLEMSDLGHHYSYSILEGPLPVANYRATLRLRRISDGDRTFAEWSASFDPNPPQKRAEAEDFVSNAVFQGGFDALKKHFGG
jgi:Polyketide cyclase / dehydrase and lipid transport